MKLLRTLSILSLVFIFSFPTKLQAQACSPSTAVTTLTTGDVEAFLSCSGSLWTDIANGNAGYRTKEAGNPADDVGMIFSGGLWMGGLDPGGNLKLAAATYGIFNGEQDYSPGPLTEEGQTNEENCQRFDRHWKVTRAEIEELQLDLADNVLDNPIPFNLKIWPAKGNPYFETELGFSLPETPQGLAPFFDQDGDGIYDPAKGDYPDIHDADQAVWWVINDGGNIHLESNGDPLQMEVQIMAYSYDQATASINSTTFYDFKFINRAIENIDSLYAALWIDPDLGCYTDDFIGCDSSRNMAFIYNEDATDGGPDCGDCLGGVADFCGDIPILGIKVLNGTERVENGQIVDNGMSSFMYYDNNLPIPDPALTPVQYYHFMSGVWWDATPMTKGGTGYNPSSNLDPTNYAFNGSPSDPNAWTMCSSNSGAGDRRIVISSGPSALTPGASTSMTIALFKAYGNSYPCPNLDNLWEVCEEVDQFFGTVNKVKEVSLLPDAAVMLFPNPMKDYSLLRLEDGNTKLEQVNLYSLDGRLLRSYENIQAQEVRLERKDLQTGMYLYRLQTVDGKWHSGKLIAD